MLQSRRSTLLAIAFGAGASFCPSLAAADSSKIPAASTVQLRPTPYRVGPGDVLQVTVWHEPDASAPTVVVRSDGRITLPLVKEMEVAGMTPAEIEKMVTEKMASFVKGADVSVVIKEVKSQRVFLAGAVRHEGAVPLTGPATILQIITEAGGLTDFAKPKKIYILRRADGKQVSIPFDYSAAIKGRTQQNVFVQADDIIVVPR